MPTFPEPPQHASSIMRLKQVIACTGLSRSTIYNISNPKSPKYREDFPKSIQLTPRCVGWASSEIYQWIESQIAKSRAPKA